MKDKIKKIIKEEIKKMFEAESFIDDSGRIVKNIKATSVEQKIIYSLKNHLIKGLQSNLPEFYESLSKEPYKGREIPYLRILKQWYSEINGYGEIHPIQNFKGVDDADEVDDTFTMTCFYRLNSEKDDESIYRMIVVIVQKMNDESVNITLRITYFEDLKEKGEEPLFSDPTIIYEEDFDFS